MIGFSLYVCNYEQRVARRIRINTYTIRSNIAQRPIAIDFEYNIYGCFMLNFELSNATKIIFVKR
ncbi:hypothetical protein GPAL_2782 [Glaciecola pallidula DSM 14239 = ACAM 615]|uniref:Uncharacterized protein n=1 Tax=Brumicola pallidula DSM 14239 = ACAM 615 TaxID=1121922 RepID=K6ZL68_9ALTE|nr:hypothetical protein GPAL_2782 [Glaciecola pallidula DSM 14239 = ACAM 615]